MTADHKPPSGSPLRVLIVEDTLDDYDLLLRALRKNGYDVSATRVDTAQAMGEALDDKHWDIVFSDWSMPTFSALEALGVLKDRGIDLPFIIVSGTIGEDVAVEALRAGAHDFLVKDKLARLQPAVERELREARIRRESQRMQEQLMISDRMASVGILAAGVAHEINNPLASVIANLDLAAREIADLTRDWTDTPQVRDLRDELADAREAADRIRNIVRDLKLFSRADDDQRSAIDARRVMESSLRMAQNEIRHRARLVKRFEDVPLIEANESRLGQVFLNLIVNATQALPEGRAEANEIRVGTRVAEDGRVVVEVSDTGSGMMPEVQKRLFTPFFTTKPVGVGTGLGLSICHRLITAIGGEITVDSAPGKGTTFFVHLPPAHDLLAKAAETKPLPLSAPARRGRILVVDDEPLMVSVVRKTLARFHDVVAIGRAQEALDKVTAGERYDVILCDLMMPEMTGMDLHAALAEEVPEQAEKMIFLTGGAFTTRARVFLDEVPNLRIEKPFDTRALRALVNDRVR